jgi:hypothetical protein
LKSIRERDFSEGLGVDDRIILKCILEKGCEVCALESSGARRIQFANSFEHRNKYCGFVEEGKIVYQLSDYKILQKLCVLVLVMSLLNVLASIPPSQVPRHLSYILLKELVN